MSNSSNKSFGRAANYFWCFNILFFTNNLLLAAQVFVTWTGEGKMHFEIISLGIFREAGEEGGTLAVAQ